MRKPPIQFFFPVSKNPKLLSSFARGAYRKFIQMNLDYNKKDGSSNSLWLLSLRITHNCNHRCAICGQWGRSGYNAREDTPKVMGEVPLEIYKKVIDNVAPKKVHVYITGGEPFLYKSLVPLVNYIKKKGLTVQIVTNGVGLEKNAETIVGNGWDMLCVSLDGPREIHDKCRGLEGAFETATKGIRKIQQLKKERKRHKPAFYIITTISKTNELMLLETIKQADKLKTDGIVFYYSWFTRQDLGEKHTKLFQKLLNTKPFAWRSYIRDTTNLDINKIVEQVRKIKSGEFKTPVMFVPDLKLTEIRKYYYEPENFLGYKKCLAPWFQVDIMPNGDVVNCRDFPDFVTGNIKKSSIVDIYNGERHRRFRRALRSCKNSVFPTCSRCCGLMGY